MQQDKQFIDSVWEYYRHHGRDLPWRQTDSSGQLDRYKVLVSEFMLQQTQVTRVVSKFNEFLDRFPSLEALATAPLADVLKLWNGLGYNRRAKYLHDAARALTAYDAWSVDVLVQNKGIGYNTAAAIMVYSANQPHIFIETNIRTVYIYHFFDDMDKVSDTQLHEAVARTLDREYPRDWYWALMDYGTYLKGQRVKTAVKSTAYARQPTFKGSNRQVRGAVIRLLTQGSLPIDALSAEIPDERLPHVLKQLTVEGLITVRTGVVSLA